MELIRMQGRFAIDYDFNAKTYWFSTLWGDGTCRARRTITEEEAETLQRILMCGYIPKEENNK